MSLNTYKDVAHTNGYEFTQGGGYELPSYPFVPPPELGDKAPAKHPIVIVGGGITGLTLACSLARLGVKAILLDEDDTVGVKGASSRGICYTQKSLEIFERLGVYDRIAGKGLKLDKVLELRVDQSKLVDRIVRRAEEARAAGQPVRKDDDPEVFKTRLEAYNRDTAIVAPYYEKRGQLTPIDGMQPIDQVSTAIEQALAG